VYQHRETRTDRRALTVLQSCLESDDIRESQIFVSVGPTPLSANYDACVPHGVEFDDVRRLIGEFGSCATLVTVGESLRPHIVTAMIAIDGDRLIADVGARTRSNAIAHPGLTLVWDPDGDDEYQLILDGNADDVGEPNEHEVSTLHSGRRRHPSSPRRAP